VQTEVGPVTLRRAGEVVDSETTLAAVGPHVVVVTTVLPDRGEQFTTTYVGAEDAATVAVDLRLGARPEATSAVRELPRELVPTTHARLHCLLDHARQVMNALWRAERVRWTVEVSDPALESADSI
jgi:hypothetical protein